ncbi:hypothetical protein LRE75_33185 [Streptomyces sp. 372A]
MTRSRTTTSTSACVGHPMRNTGAAARALWPGRDDGDEKALDRSVDAIAHLPALLFGGLYSGLGNGFAQTRAQHAGDTDGRDLIEADVRLDLLPSANALYLPHPPDLGRAEGLTAYLVTASAQGADRPSVSQPCADARMTQQLPLLRTNPATFSNSAPARATAAYHAGL